MQISAGSDLAKTIICLNLNEATVNAGRWVNLKKDGDAEKCLQGIQCVGLEIAQLRKNIERMQDK